MNIILTGSRGFLGSNLSRQLRSCGFNVIPAYRVSNLPFDRNSSEVNLEWPEADLNAFINLNKVNSIIIAGAADLPGDDYDSLETLVKGNVLIPGKLLCASRDSSVDKFLFIGSSWQFSNLATLDPLNLYASSKSAFGEIQKHYSNNYGIHIFNIVLTDTYGKFDSRKKILNLILRSKLSGIELSMTPGHQMLSLVHINDVVNAIIMILRHFAVLAKIRLPQTYKVDTDDLFSPRDIVEIMIELGFHPNVNFDQKPYRKNERMNPSIPLPKVPGWAPAIKLHEGLHEMIQKDNLEFLSILIERELKN